VSELARLERVDLRTVWSHEERDFTSWLAESENLSDLGEVLGTDLVLRQTEASVGKFELDILAEEEGTGRAVVIENQLEATDHAHLGQLVTYASGFDASMIVWIVREIREEYRQAIEWLNERTDERTGFFLVRIELWRIGESPPAPKFDVVVRPNEWAKAVKKGTTSGGELSSTQIKQLDFWTRFKAWVAEANPKVRLQTPRPQHWYDVSIGTSDAHITLTVNTRDNCIAAELYIPDNKPLFFGLQTREREIAERLGADPEWIEATKATRIKLSKPVSDVFSEEEQEEYFRWLLSQLVLLKKVFPPLMKQVPRGMPESASTSEE